MKDWIILKITKTEGEPQYGGALEVWRWMVLNTAQAAGSSLIWWEVRKQTQISAAQFEERRTAWLSA